MVLQERIELSTSPLPRECSTTELPQHAFGRRKGAGRVEAGGLCHRLSALASLWRGQNRRPGRGRAGACPEGLRRLKASRFYGVRTAMAVSGGPERQGAAPAGDSGLSPAKLAEKQRLAEALRANLRRRKAQAKARAADAAGEKAGD